MFFLLTLQHLVRSLRLHPFGISAPLGINIPEKYNIEDMDFNNETDWSFLVDRGIPLECFGGNHILEATKLLYEEKKNTTAKEYYETKLCTVYYGLTDDEIIKVKKFPSLY